MERGSGRARGRRQICCAAAAILITVSMAACSVASPSQSPSGSAEPTASPTPTATLAPTESPTPVVTPSPEPTDTPTPPLPKGPLPSLSPVSTGKWTGIKWIAIPGGHSPTVPSPNPYGNNARIVGWSKGYIEFLWDPHKRTLIPWASADGLTWRQGNKLDISVWNSYLKSHDAAAPDAPDDCEFMVADFHEGPATLLLEGNLNCSGGCSVDYVQSEGWGSWTSSDGLSWTPAVLPYANYGRGISGGSNGFIGVDSSTSQPTVWLSADGRTWRRGGLPKESNSPGFSVSDPVAIAGGYVLPGVVGTKKGSQEDPGECMSGSDENLYQGAVWWSQDGTNWTRDTLSGASLSTANLNMAVYRIDDHTVVADLTTFKDGQSSSDTIQWASGDGKTWTRLKGTPVTRSGYDVRVVVGRDRGLVIGDPTTATGWPSLSCFNGGLSLAKLQQSGSVPWIDYPHMALGPTGLLVTQDGSRFWIGVPTAG